MNLSLLVSEGTQGSMNICYGPLSIDICFTLNPFKYISKQPYNIFMNVFLVKVNLFNLILRVITVVLTFKFDDTKAYLTNTKRTGLNTYHTVVG